MSDTKAAASSKIISQIKALSGQLRAEKAARLAEINALRCSLARKCSELRLLSNGQRTGQPS